jgi:adenylate cyclase
VLQEIAKSIDAKLAFFLLYDKKSQQTDVKVSGQLKTSTFVQNNYNAIYDMSRTTLDKGEITDFSKVNKDIYSAVCTPIVVGENHVGVFGVVNSNKPTGFGKVDRNILNAIASQADSAVFEDIEKGAIKKTFQRYVSPEVIDTMMENEGMDFMKTDRKELTVLFSDVRGFTNMSEKLEAEQVVEVLNEHFEVMSEIILKQRGTLDKFVGDEIMALFGAPIYVESHALKAIKTALDMQKAQRALSQKIKRRIGVDVDIGIGINTGDMVVGNIGSQHRTDYTVIGDNVNIAARLCSAAKPGEILITEQTYAEVKKLVEVEAAEPIKAKGKSKPLQIYKVVGLVKA